MNERFPRDLGICEESALIAAREILQRLNEWFPEVRVPTIDDYRVDFDHGAGQELARMMNMEDIYTETSPTLTLKTPSEVTRVAPPKEMPRFLNQRPGRRPRMYEGSPNGIDVVMSRDSFGNRIFTFMNAHFKTMILYPREDFYVSLDTDFKTDVVIMEMAERSLIKKPGKPRLPR